MPSEADDAVETDGRRGSCAGPETPVGSRSLKAAAPGLTGEICFRGIGPKFKARGVTYRDLAKLARLGYLTRTGEGRYAVYYRLAASHPRQASAPYD
jgi:hypothetical protein